MAVYVTSDAHGHVKALDEALQAAGITSDDKLYVLGDMIDRGPDPLGVIKLLRTMPQATILKGNHEDLMLSVVADMDSADDDFWATKETDMYDWVRNGGSVTLEQCLTLEPEERTELVSWMSALPAYAIEVVDERPFILTHAGIMTSRANAWRWFHKDANLSDPAVIKELLDDQIEEDLMWVRSEFWSQHTGLLNKFGEGPIVVAGHTPTIYLSRIMPEFDKEYLNDEQKAQIVMLGDDEKTLYIPDRIDIDASAAAGHPVGRVAVMRLDDFEVWYGSINENE